MSVDRPASLVRIPAASGAARRLTLAERAGIVYVGSIPFDGLDIGGRSLPFLVGAVYVALATLDRLGTRGTGPATAVPVGRAVPAFLFAVWCMASYLWSLAPDATLGRAVTLLVLLVTSWFLARDLSRTREAVLVAFTLGSTLLSFLVLAAPASIDSRRTASGNANDVAMMLMLGAACALWLALNASGLRRVLALGALAATIPGVVATGSRTAVVGGAVMVVAVAVRFAWRREWRRLGLVAGMSALGVWLFSYVPPDAVPERLRSITEALQQGQLSNREYLWEAIVDRGVDVAGIGAAATPEYLGSVVGRASAAHNVFLGILLEVGVVGLVLFAAVLVRALSDGRSSPYRDVLWLMLPVLAAGALALTLEARRSLWFAIALAWVVPAGQTADSPEVPPR